MKLTITTVLLFGMAAMVNAKAAFTNLLFDIQAGQPFNLTWKDDSGSGPFTLELRNGPSNNLKPVMDVGSTSNNFLIWTPPSTLPTDEYAFVITDSTGVPNYSVQWAFHGLAAASSSPSSSTVTTATTSALSSTTSVSSIISIPSTTRNSSSSAVITPTPAALAPVSPSSTGTIVNSNDGQRTEKPIAFLLMAMAGFLLLN